MSVPVLVWLAVGLVTSVLLVVLVVGLVRQVRGLATTAKRFRDEIDPVAEELRRETDRANARAGDLQRRGGRRSGSEGRPGGRS